MNPELAALTATAATTLVERLTTDGWGQVASAMGALWRRVHLVRSTAIEAELTETRIAVLEARQDGDGLAEQYLVREWRSRLGRLVAADPSIVEELRQLVEEWVASASDGKDTRMGRVDMRARASGHGRVTMAGRDIHITES